jgi:ACT domain-containing protein
MDHRETTQRRKAMKKTIITVTGRDTVGIIAKVCNYLAENNVNIEDISQTILQGYFHMMMITDTSGSDKTTADLSRDLDEIGESIGVKIHCQREDIFDMMHRI